jgi:hypothetical protein
MRFAAYDTESVDPFATGIGNVTFHADVTHASAPRRMNTIGSSIVRGKTRTNTAAPNAMTTAT